MGYWVLPARANGIADCKSIEPEVRITRIRPALFRPPREQRRTGRALNEDASRRPMRAEGRCEPKADASRRPMRANIKHNVSPFVMGNRFKVRDG